MNLYENARNFLADDPERIESITHGDCLRVTCTCRRYHTAHPVAPACDPYLAARRWPLRSWPGARRRKALITSSGCRPTRPYAMTLSFPEPGMLVPFIASKRNSRSREVFVRPDTPLRVGIKFTTRVIANSAGVPLDQRYFFRSWWFQFQPEAS